MSGKGTTQPDSRTLGIVEPIDPGPLTPGHRVMRLDSDGRIIVTNVPVPNPNVTKFDSGADVASAIIKASPGTLLDIFGVNGLAAATPPTNVRYLHFFDAVAVPANGTAPEWVAPPIQGQQPIAFTFPDGGLPFITGIVMAVSTTRTTLTLAGADMWLSARFI